MSYSAEVLADSPLAYYRHGEPSGTTMTDSSGNGRNGTYSGVTLGATGLLVGDADTAVTINGATARGEVADAAWMDTGTTLTVEAWIKTSTTGVYQYIVDRDTTGRLWDLRLRPNGNLEFEKIAGTFVSSVATTTLNDGNVHQVAFTYDGANIRLYADGVLVKTTAATGSLDGTSHLAIGATYAGGGGYGVHRFIGVVDEVSYYGTTLSGTRIADHYTAGTTGGGISAAVDAAATTWTTPAISVPIATDNSNGMGGWQLGGYATARVTTPVAADPFPGEAGVELELAKYLPPPTIVNGEIQ